MRIAVIGASGGIGRAAVEQALGHGDRVHAIVRSGDVSGVRHDRLEVFTGDVRDVESLAGGIAGCDAVVSAIGVRPSAMVDLYSTGIANIMQTMIENGVPRLSAVSAAGTFARTDRNLSFAYRTFAVRGLHRGTYDDLERMEQRIMASSLAWTIVRPAALTHGPLTGDYRVGLDGRPLHGGSRVSRADVAAFLLKSLASDRWVRRAVSIAY